MELPYPYSETVKPIIDSFYFIVGVLVFLLMVWVRREQIMELIDSLADR
jgi:hypothetical protein